MNIKNASTTLYLIPHFRHQLQVPIYHIIHRIQYIKSDYFILEIRIFVLSPLGSGAFRGVFIRYADTEFNVRVQSILPLFASGF